MVILDLLQYVLLTDAVGSDFTCEAEGAVCPASAFTAIGAAFATQGYFVQADMLYFLTQTGFSLWAPLIYIMAAAGGMISLAMGMPPKMYMWFFFGPALYNWLLFTTEEVHGVQWSIANIEQDQREVWKLSEAGLLNTNIVQREADPEAGSGNDPPLPHRESAPDAPVRVSNLFIWFDSLISGTAQWLVRWSGIYSLRSGDGQPESGIFKVNGGNTIEQYDRWYLMSNLKWSLLETIVGARLHNAYVRDLFTSFLSSECGDALSARIDKKNFVAASHSSTGRIPCSVFIGDPNASEAGTPGECLGNEPADYKALWKKLVGVSVPVPLAMQKIWEDKGTGSLHNFFGMCDTTDPNGVCTGPGATQKIEDYFTSNGSGALAQDDINCVDYLYIIINGFRWEAGHIFHQLVMNAPLHMSKDGVLFHLFYAWHITKDGEELVSIEDDSTYGTNGNDRPDELESWATDLILIHLFRNEMRLAPPLTDRRFSGGAQIQNDVDAYQATVASKSKFGEVYTWALMVPYLQGVLMYLLAMGYPFACILIVVPGWHKALFTWMSFWAWVKLWDVGFAIVGVLERSIWAMLGNNSTAQTISPMIYKMQSWGKVKTGPCFIDYQSGSSTLDPEKCPVIPDIAHLDVTGGSGSTPKFKDSIRIFDRALLLGANLDFDLANAYYIYIMSALYFAVPAATGQLVLGAKAGAAGMVSNMVGGAASEGGRAAGQGFTGREATFARANQGTVGQESYAKGMRQQGLAVGALNAANQATESGLMANSAQNASQQLGLQSQNRGLGLQDFQNKNQVASAYSGFRASLNDPIAAAAWAAAGGYGATPPKGYGSTGKWGYVDQSQKEADKAKEGVQNADQAAPGNAPAGAAPGGGPTGASGLGIWAWGQTAMGIARQPAALYSPQAQLAQLSNAAGNQVMSSATFGKQAALNNQQAALARQGFTANAAREGYGLAGGRMNSHADYGASMSRWQASASYGNAVAGYLGALGTDTSFLSPGSKPTDMSGMAMAGMLGRSASQAAHYATPGHRYGSYWGIAASEGSYQQGLANQVANAFTPMSFGAVTSIADNAQTSLMAGKNEGGPMQTDPTKSPYYQGK